MLVAIAFLIIGFVVLIKGAGLLVDGASSIAKRLRVSELVIGLTIVAFGTSSPELIVNIIAAISDNTELALGNIIGSNISNTLLILGITAIILPLAVQRSIVRRGIPFVLLASVTVLFLSNDHIIRGEVNSMLTRIDGLVLLLLFGGFLYYTYRVSKIKEGSDNPDIKHRRLTQSSLMVLSGMAGLFLGGKWIVDSAVSLAASWGISHTVIGLTIVAFGTSLPELVTSIMAALRKNADIAVGNIVGSNIFNLLFVLALTSTITPLPLVGWINYDLLVMIGAALMLFAVMFTGKKRNIDRWEGIVFVGAYAAYIAFIFWRT